MIDPPHFESIFPELNLRTFTAIDQKQLFIQPDDLRGWEPVRSGQGRAAAEDGY